MPDTTAPTRIVSLLPACTEVACALGFEENLVGRSHECDFPESIRSLPVCTQTRIDSSKSSGDIDRQVREGLSQALSLYTVKMDRLRELKPDIILTQTQCEACGVHLDEVLRSLRTEGGLRARVISWNPTRMADLWTEMRRVAGELGVEAEGLQVIRDLKARVVKIIEKVCLVNPKPSVACLEWLDPLMASGNWVPDMVDIAAGKHLFVESGGHSVRIDFDDLVEADPDVILLTPCGFGLVRARKEGLPLRDRPGWSRLKAVKKKNVYLIDGNQFFNRPGPRLVDSFEILAEILHPKLLDRNYEGAGWERF